MDLTDRELEILNRHHGNNVETDEDDGFVQLTRALFENPSEDFLVSILERAKILDYSDLAATIVAYMDKRN